MFLGEQPDEEFLRSKQSEVPRISSMQRKKKKQRGKKVEKSFPTFLLL